MLWFLILSGCGDKPTNEPSEEPSEEPIWDPSSTVCGQIEIDGDWCGGYPETVSVWSLISDTTPCSENDGFDTGAQWDDWRDAEVAEFTVDDNGRFQGTLDAGEYGFTAQTDQYCVGCNTAEITDNECTEVTLNVQEMVTVDAPNVYLYPEESTAVHVRVAESYKITNSDPLYPRGGWWSIAEPDGQLLTKDGWKDFLFYEILMDPNDFQRNEGWCIHGEQGQVSIEKAMENYGFLANEIWDFSDFWDSEFPEADWMTVYPQVDDLLPVSISPRPDSFLRVWFLVENGCNRVYEPEIPEIKRTGFHASEWGVIIGGNLEGPTVLATGLTP
jgi:hypothetical protein